jgi:transposase
MTSRRYRQHDERYQLSLIPEQLIDDDNPVRAIDSYINTLDLPSLGFTKTCPTHHHRGQPAYNPADLLKLYLYGYLNGIRSSRKLERECRRNIEVIWLIGHQIPCYKTISDFRKENAEPLVKIGQDFVLLCRCNDLVGGEVIAVDGSFFHGNASKASITTEKKLKRQVQNVDKRIDACREALSKSDVQESDRSLQQQSLTQLNKRKHHLNLMFEQLKTSDTTQISSTDSDARLLAKSGQRVAGYNIQTAVDDKYKLIIASRVTHDGNDQHQLYPMSVLAKNNMEVEELSVLADGGYFESEQIYRCLQNQITPYVPEPDKQRAIRRSGRFARAEFTFDSESNTYICPEGKLMFPRGSLIRKNNKLRQKYASNSKDCSQCLQKSLCTTPQSKYRQIYRWEHEDIIESHRIRMSGCRSRVMIKRASLVEHPFGTLKTRAGWLHFLVRGFRKVRAEWSLMETCYNLTRVLNIMGVKQFIKYCRYLQEVAALCVIVICRLIMQKI